MSAVLVAIAVVVVHIGGLFLLGAAAAILLDRRRSR